MTFGLAECGRHAGDTVDAQAKYLSAIETFEKTWGERKDFASSMYEGIDFDTLLAEGPIRSSRELHYLDATDLPS